MNFRNSILFLSFIFLSFSSSFSFHRLFCPKGWLFFSCWTWTQPTFWKRRWKRAGGDLLFINVLGLESTFNPQTRKTAQPRTLRKRWAQVPFLCSDPVGLLFQHELIDRLGRPYDRCKWKEKKAAGACLLLFLSLSFSWAYVFITILWWPMRIRKRERRDHGIVFPFLS